MKLQDIPNGGRFEYQGKIFTKTGPLTATTEQGGQSLIPRHANLHSLDLPAPEDNAPGRRRKLDETAVKAAFLDFYQSAAQLLDDTTLPALLDARQRFIDTLKLR